MSTLLTGSFENYLQSTINGVRRILTSPEICVFSIPKDLYGTHIEPESLFITFLSQSLEEKIFDDGEGRLIISGTNPTYTQYTSSYIGDVLYPHGVVIITNTKIATDLNNIENIDIDWKSNLPVFTTTFNCKIKDYEFNHTQNPTAFSGSNTGIYIDTITGSAFQPYITSVGLYNDANELIAIEKFGQPIPKTPHTDMTFIIKLDM